MASSHKQDATVRGSWEIEYVITNEEVNAFYDHGLVIPKVGDLVAFPKEYYAYGQMGMPVVKRLFRPDDHSVTVYLEA